jgi:hypothetical protein
MRVDGKVHQQPLIVSKDPGTPADAVAVDVELEWWLEMIDE